MASGLAFGATFWTRGILREFSKEVPTEASKGAFGKASGRLRRGFGTRGTLRRAPKGGCFGVARPKGVFERISERVFERFSGGFRGGRLWSLDSQWAAEIHQLDQTDRNARDDEGRWIKDLRLGFAG